MVQPRRQSFTKSPLRVLTGWPAGDRHHQHRGGLSGQYVAGALPGRDEAAQGEYDWNDLCFRVSQAEGPICCRAVCAAYTVHTALHLQSCTPAEPACAALSAHGKEPGAAGQHRLHSLHHVKRTVLRLQRKGPACTSAQAPWAAGSAMLRGPMLPAALCLLSGKLPCS